MILKQHYLNCLAHASYLVADEAAGTALIIDPQRDVEQYLTECSELGLTIKYVLLTHCHADFVAGHLELRKRAGAQIAMGAQANAEFEFIALKDDDTLELGALRLKAMETPGHTLESISLLLYDTSQDADKPHAVFTGDTLFIGDVGRPDLQASVGITAEELAGKLYDSLREKLMTLPDETLVYPAHGAGSLCGAKMSKETVSTIGEQRRTNYALQPMERQEFVDLLTAEERESPAYFSYDAVLNTKEHATLDEALQQALTPLSLDEVLALRDADAQLLDTRDGADFARAHLAGSLNIGLGGQYATWAGSLLDRERPIVVIAEPGSEEQSAMRLGRIGFDHVTGYLKEGIAALEARRGLADGWDRLGPAELQALLDSAEPPVVIDVRTEREHAAKKIEGSVNLPLSRLAGSASSLDRDRSYVVHCAGGYRSAIAASILQREGFPGIAELAGGVAAWQAAKMPLESAA
jgi:glyoxylase-like metal-dependent hydrolase (beta-lactamase superfamily II)